MPVKFVKGDLFASPSLQAYAHGCNTGGRMQRGIAVAFRDRWPVMHEEYKTHCTQKRFALGDVFYWTDGVSHVFNLATQLTWDTQADIGAIRTAVTTLTQLAAQKNIGAVGIPKVGAGLGGLDWEPVKAALTDIGEKTPVQLIVFESYVEGLDFERPMSLS